MKPAFSIEKLKNEYIRPQVNIQIFNNIDVLTASGDGDWVEDRWDIPVNTNIFSP